ncbi:MAG: lipocalin family protein [Pseudomonadota bacterium]
MRVFAFLALMMVAGCASVVPPSYRDTSVTISSKAAFDAQAYAGLWYEIASFPTPFQEGCTRTTARYTPRLEGGYTVLNSCFVDGELDQIEGVAVPDGPGRLLVSFKGVPFVKAPYWVLWVDADYETAVVGTPSGRGGWILSRTPEIRADKLTAARRIFEFNGYDLSALRMTPQ